ncbi:hypothetical protein DITRI_Ditri17bG0014600 [Diplodiscus trichospermus]
MTASNLFGQHEIPHKPSHEPLSYIYPHFVSAFHHTHLKQKKSKRVTVVSSIRRRKIQSFSKMNSRKVDTLLIILVVLVAILSQVRVEATRVLPEDFAKANNLETYSSVYEKAKFTMSCWFERLASGPSPRGPGH